MGNCVVLTPGRPQPTSGNGLLSFLNTPKRFYFCERNVSTRVWLVISAKAPMPCIPPVANCVHDLMVTEAGEHHSSSSLSLPPQLLHKSIYCDSVVSPIHKLKKVLEDTQ